MGTTTCPAPGLGKDRTRIVQRPRSETRVLQRPEVLCRVLTRLVAAAAHGRIVRCWCYWRPTPPAAGTNNWVQTIPGKHWFSYFRFYGPLEPYFDPSWKLGDITPVGDDSA